MHPDDIIRLLQNNWKGTAEELSVAVWTLYDDVRSSYVLALGSEMHEAVQTVDDYMGNNYGDEQFGED